MKARGIFGRRRRLGRGVHTLCSCSFPLTETEQEALEQLAERHSYASRLLGAMSEVDGKVSEIAIWNAKEDLLEETNKRWPQTLPGSMPAGLRSKIKALFDEID